VIRCGGTSEHYIITNLLLSLFWKNFWNDSTFGKVLGKSWLPQSPCAPGKFLAERWRTRLRSTYGAQNCCNTNPDSMIDKYQTGVIINHLLLADWYCSSLSLPPLNPGVTNFQGHSFKTSVTHPLPSIIYSPSTWYICLVLAQNSHTVDTSYLMNQKILFLY